MKKKVLLLIALLLPLMANAQICVNGIYYNLTSNGTYQVTKNPNEYSGEIIIPSMVNGIKVTEIDNEAFMKNFQVTAIHLPITIEKIGIAAFGLCNNITTFEIPENVKWIGAYAFGMMANLWDVYCYAKNIALDEDIFYKTKTKKITLHVQEANIDYFKKADQWKKINKIVATTEESWAAKEQKREIAEKERVLAEARQKQIRDSIAAREKQIKDSIEAKKKVDADIAGAKNGDTDALYRLGARYAEGDGVAKDINQAITYFKQAADSGNVKSQLYLGGIYYNGLGGVDKDINKALPYLKKAADNGDVTAQLYLGKIYYNGESGNKDEKMALLWYDKAAAQGNEYAIDFKKKYQREHESYWESEEDWRMVFPNGLTVTQYASGIITNNFRIRVYAYPTKARFDEILNRKQKFMTPNGFRNYIVVKESSLEYYNSLTDNQKNELLKKEMSIVSFEGKGYVCTYYTDAGAGSNTYDGTFENGKFISMSARLASLTKRFGFNPMNASIKQIFTPGRSVSLTDDYAGYLRDLGKTSYGFKLRQSNGTSKLYRIFRYDTDWIGSMWVNGGKITSVSWR